MPAQVGLGSSRRKTGLKNRPPNPNIDHHANKISTGSCSARITVFGDHPDYSSSRGTGKQGVGLGYVGHSSLPHPLPLAQMCRVMPALCPSTAFFSPFLDHAGGHDAPQQKCRTSIFQRRDPGAFPPPPTTCTPRGVLPRVTIEHYYCREIER